VEERKTETNKTKQVQNIKGHKPALLFWHANCISEISPRTYCIMVWKSYHD